MADKNMRAGKSARRNFLKGLAGIGSVTSVSALAGCTGDSGGTGDSNGGDGGNGGGQKIPKQELQTVTSAMPPVGHYVAMFDHFEEAGVFDEVLRPHGIKLDMKLTWEDVPLFAAGKVDVGFPGAPKAAILAAERKIPLTLTASILKTWQGMQMKADGPFIPQTTGSEQATIDKIHSENAKIGIGTWSGGSVNIAQWIWPEVYGYEFTKDNFEVAVVDYTVVPELLGRNRIAMGQASPMHGAANEILNHELIALHYQQQWLSDLGYGVPPLNNIAARTNWVENHPEAMFAITELINKGLQWIHENTEQIKQDPAQQEHWGYDSQKPVKLVYDFLTANLEDWDIHPSHKVDVPVVPKDGTLTDEIIEKEKNFVDIMTKNGSVPENWDKWMTYTKHTTLK